MTQDSRVIAIIAADRKMRKAIRLAFKAAGDPLTSQAVLQWVERGVPSKRVAIVSEVTGIPPHEIRPDIFPAPRRKAP